MSIHAFPRNSWAFALTTAAILAYSPVRATGVSDADCEAYAGSITTDSTQQCLVNGSVTLIADPGGDAVIPPGYQLGYVLTRTNGLSIEQVGPDPSFTVSGVDAWRIHSIVYDPGTFVFASILDYDHAYELQDALVQGGGSICASLNISGAFTKTTECPTPCLADAAGIEMEFGPHCLVDGSATLTAIPDGDVVVPAGFTTLFILTRTNGLVLEQVSTIPSFTVNTVDVWRIHTLVYDPATLDLGIVVFGSTNAYEVQDLLIQGGGAICASLDISGSPAKTIECHEACTADAGSIGALNPDLCLVDGEAQLEASPDGNAAVPDGYSVIHVLTTGTGLVIIGAGAEPSFTATATGLFTIHTLVYDPATLDLSGIVMGETTGFDVNALLLQGGGTICGGLDVTGAQFQVADCAPVCQAYAGTLSTEASEVCFTDDSAELVAMPNGDAVVPDAYQIAYVLTQGPGLIIQSVQPVPAFEATVTGEYTIHTLVYDPFTLDPYAVEPGTATGFDVNALLIQGGGSICGSLDVAGVPFTVIDCAPPCTAGPDADTTVCSTDAPFSLFDLLGPDVCSQGVWTNQFNGLFNPASDPSGVYTYTAVLNNGTTDVAFITVNVIECPGPCDANAGSDANVSLCTNQPSFALATLLNGDNGGLWTNPDGLPFTGFFNPATDAAGTYTYVVGASDECDGDTAVVSVSLITAPDAGASSQLSLCDSDAPVFCLGLLGGTPEEGGTWTGPNGAPFNGTFDPAVDLPGVYTYIVAGTPPCADDQATLAILVQDCCDAGESAEITVCFTDPPFPMFDQLGGNPCPGGSWTDPAAQPHSNTFNAAIDASGVYTYTVPGAPGEAAFVATLTVSVIECPNDCEAAAGTLSTDGPELCLENGSALLVADPTGDAVIPAGYETLFVLSEGQSLLITDAAAVPFFTVSAPGLYTIHTLVYDPNTLDISAILFGTTTGGDVNALLIQGGGNICASLDVAGAQFLVTDCGGIEEAVSPDKEGMENGPSTTVPAPAFITLLPWPNPAIDLLRMTTPVALSNAATITITDALGRAVDAPISINGNLIIVHVHALPAGSYTLRALDTGSSFTGRFARARN